MKEIEPISNNRVAHEVERYFVKSGYQCNIIPGQKIMFKGQQDMVEDSLIWQYEVYKYANKLLRKHELRNVLDIGCGLGMKLKKIIFPVCKDITGIDEPSTILWCKQRHDFGAWYADNLEEPKLDLGRTFDLIIAADVIEHLVDPDKLLEVIKRHASKETFIILSTPERDATRGKDDMGPPLNTLHAREWNFNEFGKYIEYNQLTIISHFRVEASTSLQFQDASKLRPMIIKIAIRFLQILRGERKFLKGGQVIVAKYEFH